jgi:TRAP-type mannitol/chloroaromatic compound transport system permease small subunit
MKNSKVASAASHCFSAVGAIAVLTILVVTVADVVMSKIFDAPFPGATEIVTSVMPISVFAYLLTTQMRSRHINVDIILERISAKWKLALKTLSLGIGIYLFGLLTYLNIPLAIYSLRTAEHTGGSIGIPVYPAKILIPIACCAITIQLLFELYKEWKILCRGDNQ